MVNLILRVSFKLDTLTTEISHILNLLDSGEIAPFTPMGEMPHLPDIQSNKVTLFSNINNDIRCSYLSIGLSINTLCGGILTDVGIPTLRNWLLSSTENTVVKYNQGVMTSPVGGCLDNQGVTDNKKGSTANATSLNNSFINHCANDNSDNNANLFNILVQRRLTVNHLLNYFEVILNEVLPTSPEFLSWCASIAPVINPLAKSENSKKSATITASCLGFMSFIIYTYMPIQPLGSIPRDCSSFLITRLIQAEIDSSPSISIACLIDCSNCGSTLKAICLLPLGNFVFDMCNTLSVCCLCLTVYNTFRINVKQRSPEVLPTLPRLLTHNVNRGNTMAMYKSTQTHPKFLWRFFSCQQFKYFLVEATNEQEARSMLPDSPCIFSARICQGVIHG